MYCPSIKPRVKVVDLQNYLKNVRFDGLTSKVQLGGSGDPLSASYDIINFKRRSSEAHKDASSLRWNYFPPASESSVHSNAYLAP